MLTESGVNQSAFAKMMGVSRAEVGRYKREGRLIFNDSGEVMPEASRKKVRDTTDPGTKGDRHSRDDQDNSDRVSQTYQHSRAVRERYAALKEKAEYEEYIGTLVLAEDVKAAGAELGILFRGGLEAWPERYSAMLAAEGDEASIRDMLSGYVETLLTEFESRLNKITR